MFLPVSLAQKKLEFHANFRELYLPNSVPDTVYGIMLSAVLQSKWSTQQKVKLTFTVRKTCVKRMLNAWIEHHTFNVCFYHTLYMRFEKHALNTWYEKYAFYHPLKSLMLTNYNPCIKIVFLETYV